MRPSQGAHQTVLVTGEAIMMSIGSAQSGTFKIGGDIQINRLGFGAMRITGPGIWGEPADGSEALRTLMHGVSIATPATTFATPS